MLKLIAAALVALAPMAACAQAQPAPEAGGWVAQDLQRMVQPDNAQRLKALTELLDARGIAYEIKPFPGSEASGGVEGRNVIVTLGDGPRDIVLGAHYDAVRLPDGRMVEGVVDNAASVVALVRAAGVLADRDLGHRIIVAFWDQEELGLLGSAAWLAQADRSRIAASVNFDVVGYGDTLIYGGMRSDSQGVVRSAVEAVCERRSMGCVPFQAFPPSDDRSFADAGVPVVSIGLQPAADARLMHQMMHADPQAGPPAGPPPRVFTLIHTANDNMSAIEAEAVALASQLAVELVAEVDARLAPR